MKQIILFSILFSLSTTTVAQKCLDIVDPITQEKKSSYEFTDNGIAHWIHIKYEYIKGQYYLNQDFQYGGKHDVIFPTGTIIYLKLESGEILSVKSSQETVPVHHAGPGGVWSHYNFVSSLTKEDLNKLSSSAIVLVRIPNLTDPKSSIDFDEKHKYVKKGKKHYQQGAACISKN